MSETEKKEPKAKKAKSEKTEKLMCGIVMPISAIDSCPEQHWGEVKEIISDVISTAGFEPNLVSDADDVGIIQKRIIQNIYDNPIVVCDVSCKNSNVMFELGMRLAFDKPVIIIKDDKTAYSFDTSPIEHLEYPRDLRFNKIIDFKKNLEGKIKSTYEKSKADSDYSPFLAHFGKFTVAKLDTQEISKEDYILEELREMKLLLNRESHYSRTTSDILTNREKKRWMNNKTAEAINALDTDGVIGRLSNPETKDKVRRYILENCYPAQYFGSNDFDEYFKTTFSNFLPK